MSVIINFKYISPLKFVATGSGLLETLDPTVKFWVKTELDFSGQLKKQPGIFVPMITKVVLKAVCHSMRSEKNTIPMVYSQVHKCLYVARLFQKGRGVLYYH